MFNIGGNKYRLITAIHYHRQRVYIVSVLPAQRMKGAAKNWLSFRFLSLAKASA